MKQHTLVGIDIGTSLTKVVVCQESSTSGLPVVVGTGIVPTHGVRHGYVISREEASAALTKALRDAERESGIRIKSAAVAIGGTGLNCEYAGGTAIVTRADGMVSKFDIDKAIADAERSIELKNKTILHAFPALFRVDGKEMPGRPEGVSGLRLEVNVLFITCFEQHLEDLLATINAAGIKVSTFTATPIAGHKLVLTELQRNFGCILIDMGEETTSVSVFENNTLTSMHVFGVGSQDITKDIALGLRISPEDAEQLKKGGALFQSLSKKKLDDIIEARLSDIFGLIDKYLRKIGRSGLLPAGAIIIGGGSLLPSIESVAKNTLKLPVRIGHLELPSSKGIIKDDRLTVAYSAATHGIDAPKTAHASASRTHDTGTNEGFLDTIKHFFKQLMP